MTSDAKQAIIDVITSLGYDYSVMDNQQYGGVPYRQLEGDKVVTTDSVTFALVKRTETPLAN